MRHAHLKWGSNKKGIRTWPIHNDLKQMVNVQTRRTVTLDRIYVQGLTPEELNDA